MVVCYRAGRPDRKLVQINREDDVELINALHVKLTLKPRGDVFLEMPFVHELCGGHDIVS
jgi:hypothetical protein